MAIEKRTIIDSIEVERTGRIKVSLAIMVVEDEEEISARQRSFLIPRGGDVDAIIASVNSDIALRFRAAPVAPGRIPLLKSICQLVA